MKISEGTRVNKLGEFIKQQRESKSLTQTDLSIKSRISVSYINCLERGMRRAPSSWVLYRIAKALDVPLDDLIKQIVDELEEE